MNRLQSVSRAVFHRSDSLTLTQDEIAGAVVAARSGDDEALVSLVRAFAPLLRKRVMAFAGVLTADEAESAAVLGLHAAAVACDDPSLFASMAGDYVWDSLKEAAAESSSVHVPARTLTRFFGVVRRAGGDMDLAAAIAPEFSLSREAFHAIADALRCGSLDVESIAAAAARVPEPSDALSALEARDLVSAAFKVTDDLETDVIRSAYGFADYRPKGDAEISGEFGLSRSSVQRARTRGLGKMREALAVDVEG